MNRKLLGLIACIALVGPAEAATYDIDLVESTYTISGTMTTNGSSPVTSADLTGYDLTVANSGTTLFELTTANASPSTPLFAGSDLTTTSTQIFFNFGDTSAPGSAFFESSGPDSLEFLNEFSNAPASNGLIEIGLPGVAQVQLNVSGNVLLGSVPVSATPLPAALPLFAGGLGLIGWLGRRRKRQGTLAAA